MDYYKREAQKLRLKLRDMKMAQWRASLEKDYEEVGMESFDGDEAGDEY